MAAVEFLSEEWFAEIARRSPPVPTDLRVVVEQRIAGMRTYQVMAADGRLSAGPPTTVPDVIVMCDQPTAVALARRELTAHDAFLAGRVRLRGDLRHLQQAVAVVAAMGEALADLGHVTTYPP